jgi:hypothetical protein
MHAVHVSTISLNPRNSARLTRLSRRTCVARGRLANALLSDILDAIDFKSGRDLSPRHDHTERVDA